ncbi:MAG: heme-binding domain-containing protein [Verrucomicrobia bacterium]|nr:heme-binding domain-containing protein [Verrucomicrobiota bacterium]
MVKKILLGLGLVLLVIQFVRPAKNLSSTPPGKEDFIVALAPPPEIKQMLQVGCYDCHSDNTRYPWYAEIQPSGWWLKQHIDDGKREFNFSTFGEYSAKKQGKKVEAIIDVVTDRSMPLKSYTWIHRDAIFTDAQIKALTTWLEGVQEKLGEEK